ncbi:transmembrane O-methyltransferase homolog [Latimeria chalumnae]|uniref:catechol O-methyltransferase n=1 Tax=Latimeria chalumnae TaxID=7897 RepID=M3XGV7_LATCH|nr:PREDICTED: catechol O-methyltransferase-like [Latimeria chalumnae]|eukprot:XP_014343537.1 PREDICTED: catechol O-methyltransferase-like [Latimeria chalumnae]
MWVSTIAVSLLPLCAALLLWYRDALVRFYWDAILGKVRNYLTGRSREERLHKYVLINSRHGQPDSVLQTFEHWVAEWEFLHIFTEKKGQFLDSVVQRVCPSTVLDLGTYCGYSAIRILRLLPPGGRLYSVIPDPSLAGIAEEMILVAGFQPAQFQVITSSFDEAITRFKSYYKVKTFDFILMDQSEGRYLQDLQALKKAGLIAPGTVILANHSSGLAAREFLCEVRQDLQYQVRYKSDGLQEIEYLGSRE